MCVTLNVLINTTINKGLIDIQQYKAIDFELVLTVCDHAREACPWFPSGAQLIHHSFSDPSKLKGTEDEIKAAFRKTRSEIKAYCKNLAEKV